MARPMRKELVLSDLGDRFEPLPLWMGSRPARPQGIRVEDCVEDQEYVVRAELPGLDPDKYVAITVQRGVLTIRAERREDKSEKTRSKFRHGSFARSVRLPDGADEDNAKPSYKDGILTVQAPFQTPSKQVTAVATGAS